MTEGTLFIAQMWDLETQKHTKHKQKHSQHAINQDLIMKMSSAPESENKAGSPQSAQDDVEDDKVSRLMRHDMVTEQWRIS